jgi:protein-tyrosine phosphatase
MVAIAMIEYGAKPEEAIKLIRNARPGSLNMKQTNFLLHYKSRSDNA